MGKIKLAIMIDKPMLERTISPEDMAWLREFAEIVNEGTYPDKIDCVYMKEHLPKAEACFTCWGTPPFTKEILDQAPNLRVILHGAGTPKAIVTDAVWERGIRVATAAPVIAIDVAETALGGMIYCLKRFREFESIMREGRWSKQNMAENPVDAVKPHIWRLNWMLTVGIISASHVGKNMIRFLKPFGVNILLYDPCVSRRAAEEMGVTLCSLDELMSQSHVVSIHAPKLPETDKLINAENLKLVRDNGLIVNTSRGSVIDEPALIAELQSGRLNAYLDVYEQEPPAPDNPLLKLPNVLITPHISGGHTVNGGFERGSYIVNQLFSFAGTGTLRDETIAAMLPGMA